MLMMMTSKLGDHQLASCEQRKSTRGTMRTKQQTTTPTNKGAGQTQVKSASSSKSATSTAVKSGKTSTAATLAEAGDHHLDHQQLEMDHQRYNRIDGTDKMDSRNSYPSNSTNVYRKQNHCEIEKRRRDKMNHYIMELASVIPSFNHHTSSNQSKLDKLTVLRMAVQHVKSLRSSLCSFSSFHLRPSFLSSGDLLKNLILEMAGHEAQDNLFMVVSCDRGKVLFMSESSKDILKQDQHELTGQCLFDLLHKDDVSKVKEQISHLSLLPREMLIDSRTFQPIKHNQRNSFNQIHHQNHQASSTPPPGARRSFFCRMRSGRDNNTGGGTTQSSGRSSANDKTMTSSAGSSSGSDQSTSPSSSITGQELLSSNRHQQQRIRRSQAADATSMRKSCISGPQISPTALDQQQQQQPREPLNNPIILEPSDKISSSTSSSSSASAAASEKATTDKQQTDDTEQQMADSMNDRAIIHPNLAAISAPDRDLRTLAAVAASTTTKSSPIDETNSSLASKDSNGTTTTSGAPKNGGGVTGKQPAAAQVSSGSDMGISDGSNSDCSGSAASGSCGRDSGIAGSKNSTKHRGSGCLSQAKRVTGIGCSSEGASRSSSSSSKKALRYTVMHCTGYLKTITIESDEMDEDDDEFEDYNGGSGGGGAGGCGADDDSSGDEEFMGQQHQQQRVRSKTITCLVAICRRSPMDREFEPDKPLTFTCRYSIEGKFVFADQRTTIALGYTPQQLLGTSHYAYCHKDSVNTFKECHRLSILRSEPVSSDIYQFRRANGKHMWLQTSLKSFRNPWTKFIDYIVASHTTAEGSDSAHYNEGCVPTKFNRDMTGGEGSQSSSPASSSSSPASSSSLSLPSVESNQKPSSSPSSSSIGSSYSMDSFASGGSIQALLKRIDRIKSGGIKHALDVTQSRKRTDHHHHHHHHHAPRSSSGGSGSSSARKSNGDDSGNYSDPQLCSPSVSSQTSASNGALLNDDYPTSAASHTGSSSNNNSDNGNNPESSGNFISDHAGDACQLRGPQVADNFYLQQKQPNTAAAYRNGGSSGNIGGCCQSFAPLLADSSTESQQQAVSPSDNSLQQQNYDQQQNRADGKANDSGSRGASKSARPCLNNSRQHQRQSGANNHYQNKNQKGGSLASSLASSSAWSSPGGSVYSNSASSQSGRSQGDKPSGPSEVHHQQQQQLEMDQQQHQTRRGDAIAPAQGQPCQQQRYDKMTRQSTHYVLQPAIEPVPMNSCSNQHSYSIVRDDIQMMPVPTPNTDYMSQQSYGLDMNQQQPQQMHQSQSMSLVPMNQQQQQRQPNYMHQRHQATNPATPAAMNMMPMVWSNHPDSCSYQGLGPTAICSHDHQQQQQQLQQNNDHQTYNVGGGVTLMNMTDGLGNSNEQMIAEQQTIVCHQCANHICFNQQQQQLHHHHHHQPQQLHQQPPPLQHHHANQQSHQHHQQQQHLMHTTHNNTDLNNIDFTSLVVNGDLDEDQILECLADYDEDAPFYRIQQQHQQPNSNNNNNFPQYNSYR